MRTFPQNYEVELVQINSMLSLANIALLMAMLHVVSVSVVLGLTLWKAIDQKLCWFRCPGHLSTFSKSHFHPSHTWIAVFLCLLWDLDQLRFPLLEANCCFSLNWHHQGCIPMKVYNLHKEFCFKLQSRNSIKKGVSDNQVQSLIYHVVMSGIQTV